MSPPPLLPTFLSCSVRKRDRPLVEAMERLLEEHGFKSHTIGRRESRAEHPDDAVRSLMNSCVCLVGLATVRHRAHDADRPTETLHLATQDLAQEAGAAHQLGLPSLMFRVKDVELQGVAARNLWVEIDGALSSSGRVRVRNRAAMESALADLHAKAVAKRKELAASKLVDGVKTMAAAAAAAGLTYLAVDYVRRPDCFGYHDGRMSICKACSYAKACKTEKLVG